MLGSCVAAWHHAREPVPLKGKVRGDAGERGAAVAGAGRGNTPAAREVEISILQGGSRVQPRRP